MRLEPKTPVESKIYLVDLTTELRAGDDYITAVSLVRTSGTVTTTDKAFGAKVFSAVFAGGLSGETAAFTLTIQTAGAQVLTQTLTLPILYGAEQPYSSGTKGALVSYAYEEATLAGYEFEVTTSEQATALRRLDALMAEWKIRGMDVGYNAPATIGTSAMGDVSGVPDLAFNAAGLELAKRLFPTLGKAMSAETRSAHTLALVAIRTWCARIPTRTLPGGVPTGAGMRRWGGLTSPFTSNPRPYAASASAVTSADGGGGGGEAIISDMAEIFLEHEAA